MSAQTELRLEVPPRYAVRVLAHPALRRGARGRLVRRHLTTFYYDTPRHELRQAGVSVRLRQSAQGWLQTIKWPGEAVGGLHRGEEIECPVADRRLVFRDLHARSVPPVLHDPGVRERLQVLFVIELERASRLLSASGGALVEASMDRGRIVCGTAIQPLCELELELESGAASVLFDIAQSLMSELPLRPAHRGKLERGFALAGVQSPPMKAAPPAFAAPPTVGEALAAIVGSGLEQIQGNEPGMLAGRDIEYLHQMRVGVRRLRSGLDVFAPACPGHGLDELLIELKWLGARLGCARDWDVFRQEALPSITCGLAGAVHGDDLAALAEAVRERGERAGRSARSAMRSRRASRLLLALGRLAYGAASGDEAGVGKPLLPYAARQMDRRLAQVLKRGRRLRRAVDIRTLHALRIAVKKLRYAVEFLSGEHARADVERYRRCLIALQDCLGRICDADVAVTRVVEAVPRRVALVQCVRGWCAHAAHGERTGLKASWRAFRLLEKFW